MRPYETSYESQMKEMRALARFKRIGCVVLFVGWIAFWLWIAMLVLGGD